ncbi:hypothetical protein BDV11DRAFT_176925, partial [Aspergillus similis]
MRVLQPILIRLRRQHEPIDPDKECSNTRLSIIISREEFLTPREDTTDSINLSVPKHNGVWVVGIEDGLEQANQSNIRASDLGFSIQVMPQFAGSRSNLFGFVFLPLQNGIAGWFHN